MVAIPDLKSGFQTDSNPDLTKNWDPYFRFQIWIKTGFRITNPDFNPNKSGFRISYPDLIRILDFISELYQKWDPDL
jgi:hypothetical protein